MYCLQIFHGLAKTLAVNVTFASPFQVTFHDKSPANVSVLAVVHWVRHYHGNLGPRDPPRAISSNRGWVINTFNSH